MENLNLRGSRRDAIKFFGGAALGVAAAAFHERSAQSMQVTDTEESVDRDEEIITRNDSVKIAISTGLGAIGGGMAGSVGTGVFGSNAREEVAVGVVAGAAAGFGTGMLIFGTD